MPNRMNRDEFYAAMARHDDACLRKILWTVYWRGNAQLRERIEDELRPQDQPKVKPKKELPDPAGVLDEVTTFVELAKDGAYMAGDRRCLHVTGPDDREVPVVKRGDLGQPEALGDGRHGGINDAKRKIKISLHEFGHAADVSTLEFGDLEPVTVKRPEEGHLSLRSHPRLQKVLDLAQDRRGHQQRAFRMPQEAQACLMGVILDVARSQQHASIAQQHLSGRVPRRGSLPRVQPGPDRPQSPSQGSAVMVARILDLIFIQILRAWAGIQPRVQEPLRHAAGSLAT